MTKDQLKIYICLADDGKYTQWMQEFLLEFCQFYKEEAEYGYTCLLLQQSIRDSVEAEFEAIHRKAHDSHSQGSQEQCPCKNLAGMEACRLHQEMKGDIKLLYDEWQPADDAERDAVNAKHAREHLKQFANLGMQSSSEWGSEAAHGDKKWENKGPTLPNLPS
jgi:hypothetical protein